MWGKKTFLSAAIVLILTSAANADLILSLNGLDAVKEPVEIGGKNNIVIAVAGSTEVNPTAYYIKATGGTLEATAAPNAVSPQVYKSEYSFTFVGEAGLGVVSLIANNDMAIDGTSVEEGDTIYELVLFYGSETDTVTAFGINLESLGYIPSEPEPDLQPEPSAEAQAEPEPAPEPQPKSSLPLSEQTIVPYAQRKEQEKAQSLKFCPIGAGLITATGSLPTKEDRGREIGFGEGRGGAIMGGRGVIDVDSDITQNQIWTADNTYHIVADISIQALLVIEPGTVVEFASGKSMSVNNGGTLISVGTPNTPIIYTSDSGTPGYADYYCPIYIEETASANTKIVYSYVEYAYVGLTVLNNDLETDIQSNYFYNNVYGIVEYGIKHTDIRNNLIFASYYSGIEVFLESTTGQADAGSHILIENNTCDYYQENGIIVHGVEDINEAGVVVLANNIVSGSYQYGLALVDWYMYATVTNTGYFDNANNKNWEFEEENPAFETVLPYEMGTGTLPVCYLRQDCNFINAGAGSIEDMQIINKTTDANGLPDCNTPDIGFHYCNWGYSNSGDSNSLAADLDKSMRVNFEDFAIFANAWQQSTSGPEDLDRSGFVDYNDLSILAGQWLDTLLLGVTLNQDPNSVSDVLIATLIGTSDSITCYLFMDGQYFGAFYGDDVAIPTYEYCNGPHEIKVVGVSLDDKVLVGPVINITVNNKLYCLTGSENYKYNQAYRFAGFYEPNDGSTISFEIKDLDENAIWANSSSGNFNFVVSAGVLQSPYNELTIQEAGGGSGGNGWIKDITKEFDVTNDPSCANARSLLVGVKKGFMRFGDWTYNRKEVWKEYLNACKKRGLDPTICLFFNQATRSNIQTAFRIPSVEAIYIISDGNRRVGDPDEDPNCPWRTFFDAWDGLFFSYLGRNWTSNPNNYVSLGHHESGYSVADSINYFNAKPHLHVFHDCCKNGPMCMPSSFYNYILMVGEPSDNNYNEDDYNRTRDMAAAYGINPGTNNRNYMSWRGEAFKGTPLMHYNIFLMALWNELGNWDAYIVAFGEAALADWGCYIPAQNFSHVGDLSDRFIP